MTRNEHKKSRLPKDQLVCDLELRQTQTALALEHSELRRRALEVTLHRFKRLYENSPVGFITFDHLGRILEINQAATRLLEVSAASVLGLSMTVVIAETSCGAFMEHLRKSRRAAGNPVSTEVDMISGRSTHVSVQMVTSALLLETGRIFETALIDLTAQTAAAQAITRAREYAENIVGAIPYPVVVVDSRGRINGANPAFYNLFQTSETQVVNWPLSQLPDVNWNSSDLENVLMRVLASGRPIEGLLTRAEVRGASILTLNLNARRLVSQSNPDRAEYLLVAFEDITKRRRAEEDRELLLTELQESQARLEVRVKERTSELAHSYSQLRTVGEQLVLAHESEQRRIARELHDQIGQDLTALKIILSRGKNADLDEARQTLNEAHALTDEILQTVRNICSTLRPQVLDDLGLVAGIQWHIKTFAARCGLEIAFDVTAPFDESRLSPIVKSAIFRVIQEALTNVSRHAGAKAASVILAMRNGHVEFSIRDGGRGFDVTETSKRASTGISGMRERLSLVQGRFEISSSPGQGTIIRAQIPAPPVHEKKSESNRNNDYGKGTPNQDRAGRRPSSRAQGTQIPACQ